MLVIKPHWYRLCACSVLVDNVGTGHPHGPAGQTGAGAEPDRHRYRAGDGVWYSDRAHYRPVFWLADDLPAIGLGALATPGLPRKTAADPAERTFWLS